MNSISVIICAYNEQESIEAFVSETSRVLSNTGRSYEIIIVDDGSTDRTHEVVSKISTGNPNIKVLRHEKNLGMGAAIKDGYGASKHDLLIFFPADGQIPPACITDFLAAIDGVDFVSSYYFKRDDGFFRKVLSKGIRAVTFILFGKHPIFEGTYMFRREILSSIPLISSSFVLNFEFIIRAGKKGLKYKEIGIECKPRMAGQSKVANSKKIFLVFIELIKLRLKMNIGTAYGKK